MGKPLSLAAPLSGQPVVATKRKPMQCLKRDSKPGESLIYLFLYIYIYYKKVFPLCRLNGESVKWSEERVRSYILAKLSEKIKKEGITE